MTTDLPTRRRGIYAIGDDDLARLLRLPAGQRVVSVSTDWQTTSVLLMVEGEGLPEQPAGAQTPYLNRWGRIRSLTDRCGSPDVSGLPPLAAHAVVMEELGAVRFEEPAALAGRRRILDRHRPHPTWKAWPGCLTCVVGPADDPDEWPCVDYLDATAGLVVGLPEQAEYERTAAAAEQLTDPPTAADLALLSDPAAGAALDALILDRPDTRQETPQDGTQAGKR